MKNSQEGSSKPLTSTMCWKERWWFSGREESRLRGRVMGSEIFSVPRPRTAWERAAWRKEGGGDGRRGQRDWTLTAAQIISVSVTWPLHCPPQLCVCMSCQVGNGVSFAPSGRGCRSTAVMGTPGEVVKVVGGLNRKKEAQKQIKTPLLQGFI